MDFDQLSLPDNYMLEVDVKNKEDHMIYVYTRF